VTDNVVIKIYRRGKLVDVREGHNVFPDIGREWLAKLVSLTAHDPDVGETDYRIKYMGLGMGSIMQSDPWLYTTQYPPGSDPNATSGNEYSKDYPVNPLITTLERPVRISGGVTAYPGAGGDVWLRGPSAPDFIINHPTLYSTEYHAFFDGTIGELCYSPFLMMPISEAGLFLSSATTPGQPYNTLVAYYSFATIQMTTETELEIIWTVNF
jgi:hypothetical protein